MWVCLFKKRLNLGSGSSLAHILRVLTSFLSFKDFEIMCESMSLCVCRRVNEMVYRPGLDTHLFSNSTNSGECLTERVPTQGSVFAYLHVIDRRFTSSINRHLDTSTKVYMELNGYL